mmetsp:Transcript_2884/g.7575  ORF Transcript_2884/g.7575 Transcript_2884/m.7575 type:complete len:260 (+) Transcript_2884:195-974(+)
MSNYHSTMRNAIPETTEWEDLQVKHGNWEAREKPEPPPEWAPREERSAKEKVEACDEAGDLSDLEDDFDDDRFMAQYREARLKELRMKEEAAARVKILPQGHGEPVFIKRDEFIKHVTEAEHGTWVVVFLFQNGHEGCELMSRCLTELSRKYVGTKFVKIISTDCIANYPDQLLPTFILYKDGKVQTTLEGLAKFGGKRVTPESVAFELNSLFPDDPVVTLAGHSGEQSQQEVVKSALNRFIKESENLTLSDEEDGLFD